MYSPKPWIIYSVLLVSKITLGKDTHFPICLPENGQDVKTCYTPSIRVMDWGFCIKECNIYHAELASIVDSQTYFNLLLKLLSHGGVYWIAASRNNTEWRWKNGISIPPELLRNLGVENPGNCLSLDVRISTRGLQPRECNVNYTCLCQFDEKVTISSQRTSKGTTKAVTMVPSVETSGNFSSSTPFLESVHTFPVRTSTVASQATTQHSKENAYSSGIQNTASPRIVATTATVSTAHTLETDTLPMETSRRLEFSISNANNESNIIKIPSTIHASPKSSSFTPSTQPESNASNAATAVVMTSEPSTIKHDGFNFATPLTKSLQTLYSTKTSTTVSDTTKKQLSETARYTASFCIPASGGEVCYYYFEHRRNLHEAVALCRGLGMEIFHFDNNNATVQFVREQLRNKTDGVWLGAIKLSYGWGWLDGNKFTDFWTKNILSTDLHPENMSCLSFVPLSHSLARKDCQETYSVLCQDSTGTHIKRPLSASNEFASVPVTSSRTVEISVSPVKTSSRTGSSVFIPNNVSDFASTLSFNLTNTEAATFMALTRLLSMIPTSSSRTTTTTSKGSKSSADSGNYSSVEKTLIQTSPELAVSTTNMVTMTLGSMTFPPVATELSTTVPTNTILQSVSTVQTNTVNRSKLLENFTTTVLNDETTLTPITFKRPAIPKMNTSGGNVLLSTQRTNSHVKPTVSLPVSSLRTSLHDGTTQFILSQSLAYLSTKHEYSFSSTEPDRRFRSQQMTTFIRQSTRMSNAVPTSKQPANTKGFPSDTMEQTSQLPSDSNKSHAQDISARALRFTSGSIKHSILPASTPSYYDSATTTDRIVMSQSNIAVSNQQYASKALIVGASVGAGVLLLVIILAVLIRKRMGNGKESKRQSDQPLNVCQSNGDYADGYITKFNARFIENPLYGQTEL